MVPVFFLSLFLIQVHAQVINSGGGDMIILVSHGEDPQTSKNRIVIPQSPVQNRWPGSGSHEHGQTFTKGNFHYRCLNGTAEVIACVSDDMSVIQIGRTFLRGGIRHKCLIGNSNTVTYEQKATCYENGVHYELICKDSGIAIYGCYIQDRDYLPFVNSEKEVIQLGESKIIGYQKHSCELTDTGKIRYTINLLGCRKNNSEEAYKPGQTWTDKHIRYQCTPEGTTKVLGCIDEGGLFIELGHDILVNGIVHRCYKSNNTTYYHRFQCDGSKTLAECVNAETTSHNRKRHTFSLLS